MINIQDLRKTYHHFHALKGISLEIKKGEILGLLGPNGAGKTTTMKIITGFLDMTSGTVEINGKTHVRKSTEIQKEIGYLPENAPLYTDLNVHEHLDFAAASHGMIGAEKSNAIKEAAKICGLSDRLYFDISELSKGYKQRVGLAMSLIHDPQILILDEPTTGLDPNQIVEIRELIKHIGKKKTIILSTHIMQEVEATCDRVVVMNEGKIVASGTPEELMAGDAGESVMIRITVKGSKKAVKDALSSIEDIVIKDGETITRGIYDWLITAKEDKRAQIAAAIIKAKLDLLGLSSDKQSMEQVFQHLTKKS